MIFEGYFRQFYTHLRASPTELTSVIFTQLCELDCHFFLSYLHMKRTLYASLKGPGIKCPKHLHLLVHKLKNKKVILDI